MGHTVSRGLMLALVLLCLTIWAEQAKEIPLEYSWLTSPEERRGDLERQFQKLAGLALSQVDSPVAPLYWTRLEELLPMASQKCHNLAKALTESLRSHKFTNGFSYEAYCDFLRELYGEDHPRVPSLPFAPQHWWVLGPVGFGGHTSLYRPFSIELQQTSPLWRPKDKYPGRYREISWKKQILEVEGENILDNEKTFSERGLYYLLSHIYLPKATSLLLQVSSSVSFRLWINGREVHRVDYWEEYAPTEQILPLTFPKGWSRILIKIVHSSSEDSFSFVLRDLKGFFLKLQEGKDTFPRKLSAESPRQHNLQQIFSPYQYYQQLAQKEKGNLWAQVALAFLEIQWMNLAPQGWLRLESLPQHFLQNPYVQEVYHFLLQGHPYLSQELIQNRCQQFYRQALQRDPSFLAAYLYLAEMYAERDKPLKALKILQQAEKHIPPHPQLYFTITEVARDAGWWPLALKYAKKCEALAPHWPEVLTFLESYYEEHQNYPRAREYAKRLQKTKSFSFQLAKILEKGNPQKLHKFFLQALTEKASEELLRSALDYFRSRKQWEHCLRILEHLQKKGLKKSEYYLLLGTLELERGRKELAVQSFQKALEEDPSLIWLHYYLQFLQKHQKGDDSPYHLSLKSVLKTVPQKDYPKAHVLVLAKQVVLQIFADGSYSSTIQLLHKVLDEKGKELLHTRYSQGRILELRTLDPKGRIWEPVLASGAKIVPPALMKGSILEEKYRQDVPGRPEFEFQWGPFFFQSDSGPTVINRLVAIIPKNFPIKILQHKVPPPTIQSSQGFHIYTWELKQVPQLEKEPFMPSQLEVLPFVYLYTKQPLVERLWRLWNLYEADIRPTPQLRREAQRIVKAAGASTTLEKVQALYSHVQKASISHYESSHQGSAMKTLYSREGSRGALFAGLVKSLGIPIYPALALPPLSLSQRSSLEMIQPWANKVFLWHIPLPQRKLWIYPEQRYLKLGVLPRVLEGAPVVVWKNDRMEWERLPHQPEELHQFRTHLEYTLLPSGDIQGKARFSLPRLQGDSLKERLQNRPTFILRQIAENLLNRHLPGAQVTAYHFHGLGTEAPLELTVTFRLQGHLISTGTSREYLLPLGISPLRLGRILGGRKKRQHPFVLDDYWNEYTKVELKLSPPWQLKGLPQDFGLHHSFLQYHLSTQIQGRTVLIQRRLRLSPFRLLPEQYPPFMEELQTLDRREQSLQVRLTRGGKDR